MKQWLEDWSLVIFLTFSMLGLGYLVFAPSEVVNAAPAEPVPQCAKVAETPNLAIYLCEPDNGPPFYINSYGFMVMVE